MLKEYKREVMRYRDGELVDYPPFVENYFRVRNKAILREYRGRLEEALASGSDAPVFPDELLTCGLDNTWRDTAHAVVGNWVGLVYQLTHRDRRRPFMDGIDPENPLGLPEP